MDTLLQTGINDTLSATTIEIHEIEPWPGKPGSLVTHKARCSARGVSEQDAAVMIAAEDVTVTPTMLTAAATEAPRQIHGAQLLIAAAFAFDPATTDDTQIGRLRVLRVMMNRDLQIGELDPDRQSEAFVMLAEPDLKITTDADGQIQIELRGFDTFNPRTGRPGQRHRTGRGLLADRHRPRRPQLLRPPHPLPQPPPTTAKSNASRKP